MKAIRDPLYNYIGTDLKKEEWILELIQTPEFQRLRRIHQLGVSNVTYPGADHNRLAHSLGVLHLMGMALDHLERSGQIEGPEVARAREPLLAAALLHDIGHGPFSHVFEPCLGVKHEDWSCKIIESPSISGILKKHNIPQEEVIALIKENNTERPAWQKSLLSSQLDMDRLDYIRRDSLFTGAGYGHFDWHRILNTFKIHGPVGGFRDLVWEEKSKYAIEEYVFARFYMYENVYHHRTTRGFEKILQALWSRARCMFDNGQRKEACLVKPIREFWKVKKPSVDKYLALEEFVVLRQMQIWKESSDWTLRELSRRFLDRDRLVAVCVPLSESLRGSLSDDGLEEQLAKWDESLQELAKEEGIKNPEDFIFCDAPKEKLYKTIGHGPYIPEKESGQQSPINAIRILPDGGGEPVEISEMLKRLRAVTKEPEVQIRYYMPSELRGKAQKILLPN